MQAPMQWLQKETQTCTRIKHAYMHSASSVQYMVDAGFEMRLAVQTHHVFATRPVCHWEVENLVS
jgi:hypothetical protein